MQSIELAAQLQLIGLTDKQARVYIAALFLGPSTAQKIAAEAGVNRATTYVIVDELIALELMSHSSVGKKTVFVAAPPEAITQYLQDVKTDLQNKITEYEKLKPKLNQLAKGPKSLESHRDLESIKSYLTQTLQPAELEQLAADLQKTTGQPKE